MLQVGAGALSTIQKIAICDSNNNIDLSNDSGFYNKDKQKRSSTRLNIPSSPLKSAIASGSPYL